MAGIEHRRGDHDRGIELYRRAITHYTEIDDALGVSRCAHGLGWFYMNLGEFERGLEYFRKCVELTRRLEEERDLAWGLQGLAEASLYVDDVDTAEKATREALELAREIGLRSGEGMCLTTMGNVYLARGRYDDAAAHYRAATNIFGTIDSPLVSFALVHHMRLAIETDDTRELVQLFDSMEFARVPLAFRLGYRLYGVYVAIRQSDARLDQALAHLRESLDGPLLGLHPSMRRTPGIVVDLAERHAPDRADDVRALIDKLRERLGIIS
jgi:tetratricopeptide (TPR) repeat protein